MKYEKPELMYISFESEDIAETLNESGVNDNIVGPDAPDE